MEFTKEMIRGTETYRSIKIKKEVKIILYEKPKEQKPLQEKDARKNVEVVIREKIKRDSQRISQLKKEEEKEHPFAEFFKTQRFPAKKAPLLQIHEPRLPLTVRYLRPVPTSKKVDIGKLNTLVRDPLVRIIECNGPNEKIVVIGTMGRKNTKIILNKEEIENIIRKFSEAAKIPVHEGIFKVVVGRMILNAIVSEVIGSKFIIRKMPGSPVYLGE